ncbi:MAG: hypothetical protein IT293_09735 [Deltaproteobacteria bacterium]|nr:hypothetical protein [Deltaproteobacteria bacterium]
MSDRTRWIGVGLAIALGLAPLGMRGDAGADDTVAAAAEAAGEIPDSAPKLLRQTQAEADAKSVGCLSCHQGIEPMHVSGQVNLGCVDCHGGNGGPQARGAKPGTAEYAAARQDAHVAPRRPDVWRDPKNPDRISSANPERSYAALNEESPEYIRFVNPGDLRVAPETCGGCHLNEVHQVERSLMTTSALLWGGAAYNNGILPAKRYIVGESYTKDGKPRKLNTVPPPTPEEQRKGVLSFLLPLPAWNVAQPPDPLRAFERGGKIDRSVVSEVGNPGLGPLPDLPGKPDMKFGTRGLGTDLRISAGVLNIQKTRLNDPHLSFLGTNDQPGDYRSSGCTGCHVVYANDKDPVHAASYAKYGHDGRYFGKDPTIPKDESGHPIEHRLTRAIPTSQCMVCHMHQPNSFVNTFLGYQMWDYETDGQLLWSAEQRYPTVDKPWPLNVADYEPMHASLQHNPEEAAARGLWTDREFLKNVSALNSKTKETTFADYHGHGWIFRAVYSQDRKGNLLDKNGKIVDPNDPKKFDKAVHLKDIHLEKGMHCVDCHFQQDVHSNGKIYGEYPDAIEIGCADCHGTVSTWATVTTSGPAAPDGGTSLLTGLTPWGERRFEWIGGELIQRSMLEEGKEWEVPQVVDVIDPLSKHYNEKARLAKTMRADGKTWGDVPEKAEALAHGTDTMSCISCHTSWVTSCFGCHLPQQANWKIAKKHYDGGETRNWTSYNPQVLRHDIFMLGRHSTVKGHTIAPVRSSSAVIISTTNANRERQYYQQPPVSAEGYSSQAFNAHFAHTVRAKETRQCDDCHVSASGDNNAWMAQVLTLGTNFVNFVGRFAWVGEGGHGLEAVAVTEWDEPQAVIGSNLHRMAYPDNFQSHLDHDLELQEAYEHPGVDLTSRAVDVQSVQLRGEYLYVANGPGGFRVFDVANTDNKGFSERVITAPVSPLGQRAYVKTPWATGVALPTNQPIHYGRERNPVNEEQPMHPLYKYAYVSDKVEGLVVVDVDMLADGDPRNNFLEKVASFNPDGALDDARYVTIAGEYAYVLCKRGLVVVSIADPVHPRIVSEVGAPDLVEPRAVQVQFRYAFVTDARGLRVLDVTNLAAPRFVAALDIPEAGDLTVARTYAYVPAGSQGLAIVDVERPAKPVLFQMFNANGALDDTRAVRVGGTDASIFAYVADGKNGLRVLQLITPGETPGSAGFSPAPTPRLIATRHTHGPALALSRGLERDRAVDESGHQVAVFGRLGARPFTRSEMERLFLRGGEVFTVANAAPGKPRAFVRPELPEAGMGPIGGPVVQPAAPEEERLLPGRR